MRIVENVFADYIHLAVSKRPAAKARKPSPTKRPARKRGYHHGDLRAAMVRATLAIIAEEGLEALSVRAAAQRAGVSAGAPFRHFASRRALLTAVAEEATETLAQDVMAAIAAAPMDKPALVLRAIAFAYLNWAIANPAQFEAISDRRQIDYEASPVLRARNDDIRAMLDRHIAAALMASARPASRSEVETIRIEMRALGYGLARMFIDGHFFDWTIEGADPRATMERVIDQFIGRLAEARGRPKVGRRQNSG